MGAADLTAGGMEAGVRDSRCFLIFLSDGLMSRPFCQMEQRWAKGYGCRCAGHGVLLACEVVWGREW